MGLRRAANRRSLDHAYSSRNRRRKPVADQIQHERHHKEQHADREDRPVFKRAGRRVAEADLDDVRGHGFDRHQRVGGQPRLLPGSNGHDHGLADGARHGEDERRRNARKRRRHHDPQRRLHARRAERKCAFAQTVRHRMQRILGQRRHQRKNHDAHHDARPERVEARQRRDELLQQRRHEQQREVTVDDGRNAGQHFEQRLDYPPQPPGRVFTQIDCRQKAGRQRHDHRDGRHQRGAGHQRQHAEVFFGKERRPLGAGQELDDRHFAQERERLEQQHRDDAGRDENRRRRAEKQHALDDELDDPTLPVVHFAWPLSRCSRLTFGSLGAEASNIVPVVFAGEPLLDQLLLGIGQRHVSDFLNQRRRRLDVVLDELLDLRPGQRRCAT